MNILWFTWKDQKNPDAGGAEFINEGLASRLAKNGHHVKFIVANFKGGSSHEQLRGYEINRVGNRYTVYFEAFRYFKKHLQQWPDVIIEEINTMPFMTQLYSRSKRLLFIHQLCREIWFYQFPFLLAIIGYFLEPLYLKLLSSNKVVTVSQSSATDLVKYGFKKSNITIIPEFVDLRPIPNLSATKKFTEFTLLSLGSIRPMKRTHHQIKAFELAKEHIPKLKLKIVGRVSGIYGKKILKMIKHSKYSQDIEYIGKASQQKKQELLKKSHLLLATSVKEGWGLTITEAATQGTPAIAYNVDGLRDSIINNRTGLLVKESNPTSLSQLILKLYQNEDLYQRLQTAAWETSVKYTLQSSYKEFIKRLYNHTPWQ